MKSLTKHIEEKLVINKNLNFDYDFDEIININDYELIKIGGEEALNTDTDIVSIFCDYIRIYALKKIETLQELRKENATYNKYFAGFNENTTEINIFHKKPNSSSYEKFAIFAVKRNGEIESYDFKYYTNITENAVYPLQDYAMMNSNEGAEYYEIPEKMFKQLLKIYKRLISR